MPCAPWPASTWRRSSATSARSGPGWPARRSCAPWSRPTRSGHGAVPAARAALAGGASSLAVATAQEAAELRAAGLTGPVLVLGAISAEELPVALAARAEVVAWSEPFVTRRGPRRDGAGQAST